MGSMAVVPVPNAQSYSPGELIFGPYKVEPEMRNLVWVCAYDADPRGLHRVALYPKVPALVASDGTRVVTVPLIPVDPSNYEREGQAREFGPDCGRAEVLLPKEAYEQTPRQIGPAYPIRGVFLKVEKQRFGGLWQLVVETYHANGNPVAKTYDVEPASGYPDIGEAWNRHYRPGGASVTVNAKRLSGLAECLGPDGTARIMVRGPNDPVIVRGQGLGAGILMPVA
ncbi:MAG: hypothetical protein L0216_09160 [Planctomycetales bacterium]|nr:hypothetical protein [Planctomycetales bacterium]